MYEIKFWVDKRRITEKGFPIKLRVTNGGDVIILSTGLYAMYDLEDGEFVKKEPEQKIKNMELAQLKLNVRRGIEKLEDRAISRKALKQYAEDVMHGKKTDYFVDYVDEFMGTLDKEGTIRTYRTMRAKVVEFDETVKLDGITYTWMTDFELWMRRKGFGVNYYGQIERSVRAVVNYCIDREYTDVYAFHRFKCKSQETVKRNLTRGQLIELRDYPCEEYQEKYRDAFMLMVYMIGISPCDLLNMPPLEKRQEYVVYKRMKTKDKARNGGIVKVKLEPEALEIIEKYRGKKYMLRFLEENSHYEYFMKNMNKALKKIGKLKREGRGGKKKLEPLFPKLTAYWARHTWASLAAGCGVGRDLAGKAFAHADSRTIDIYTFWDQEMIDKANREVLDSLKEKEDPAEQLPDAEV